MGIIASLFEFRSSASNLSNPKQWLVDFFGGGTTSNSGITVTPDTAMRASAVYACVRVLAETVGCTPCIVYQREGDEGRKRARNFWMYDLLNGQPNRWQTPLEFKEMMTGHVALRGNAYALIDMNPRAIVELIPLHPDRVKVVVVNGRIDGYKYRPAEGPELFYTPLEIMHLRGFSSDGIMGISPIECARESIGLSLAAEEHGARIFSNGASIRGVLQMEGVIKDDPAKERLRAQISDLYSGVRNAGKTAILEQGMKWQQIGMTSKDAEFLELRKFQVADIARIFRVPAHLIGDLEHATFSNVENLGLQFATYTMMPWYIRWEEAISRDLMTPTERGRYFAEFLVDVLLRGDIKSRYDAYAVARQWGWMSADDIRQRENMNPLADGQGKIYLSPMNMVPSDQVGKVPASEPPAPAPSGPGSSAPAPARNLSAIRALLSNAAQRIITKEVINLRKLKKPTVEAFEAFYFRNNVAYREFLQPVIDVAGLHEIDAQSQALCHGMQQIAELRDMIAGNSQENITHQFEKFLDDWTNLKPTEMVDEWMKTLEVAA